MHGKRVLGRRATLTGPVGRQLALAVISVQVACANGGSGALERVPQQTALALVPEDQPQP
jgi:hypothetical protein